jgi:hypothetical protein
MHRMPEQKPPELNVLMMIDLRYSHDSALFLL